MIAVVGMARSGLAVARLLRDNGLDVWATDSAAAPALEGEFRRLGIDFETGGHSEGRLLEASEIVVSPGVPLGSGPLRRAREARIPIAGELEIAWRYLEGDIVAVTGSNGKTTTASLVAHLLSVAGRHVELGGNIGRPASDLAGSTTPETISVLEVSSFQLESIREFRPRVGLLLNITPDHLDRYEGFAAYRLAKFRLFSNQRPDDVAILNRGDPQSFPPPVGFRSRTRLFGPGPSRAGAGVDGEVLTIDGKPIMAREEVPLRGAHNIQNVLAALLAAEVWEVGPETMREAVGSFRAVEHRLETVTVVDGVEYVNDSKATNVDSAIKAIESFEGGIILIAGGQAKGGGFESLAEAMAHRVRAVVTLGAAAESIESAVAGGGIPCHRSRTMQDAVSRAAELARGGEVVLLAPACASFDMYANYEERGADFKRAVRALAGVAT